MSRETKVPSIPDVREDNVREVLRAIKATLEVREGAIGHPLDQGATLRDLVALNLAKDVSVTGGGVGGGPLDPVIRPPITPDYDPDTDYTTPPAPTNLRASGGFTNVFLEWDGAPYRNHSFTEIWRASTDNLGNAVLIGTTAANVYADPANANTTYYYWIRFVSRAKVIGPYNGTGGTVATTAIDVNEAISQISEEIINSQLFADLSSRITVNETGITQLQQTTATSASQLDTLASVVAGNTAAIEVSQQSVDGLRAQYSVKIDNNGYVTGFGLSSSPVNGVPRSSFLVRADAFAIAPSAAPAWSSATAYSKNATVSYTSSGQTKVYQAKLANTNILPTNTTYWSDLTSQLPFTVLTSATVIDNITYPAGTYIKTAFIADATITSAKIQNLVADKITTGNLTAAIGITTGVISGGAPAYNVGTGFWLGNDSGTYKFYIGSSTQNMRWDGSALSVTGNLNATSGIFRNITVYDTNNNVILSANGVNTQMLGLGTLAFQNTVSAAQTTGFGSLATQNTVDRTQTTGFGTLAAQNTVSTGQVVGLGSLATQNDVFIGSNVRIWNGSGYAVLNTADFVNTLTRVSSANISNFFQTSAITTAYIGDAAINNAKIDNLAVNTAKIADLSVSSAKITDLAVTNAKISNAAVDTLKIGGNAVTVPTYGVGVTHHNSNMPIGWNGGNYNYGTLNENYREILSVPVNISGLGSGETAGTIVTAYITLYEEGGNLAALVSSLFWNSGFGDTLSAVAACTLGESKTNAVTSYVDLPNGTHYLKVKIKTDWPTQGDRYKNLTVVTGVVVMSGKR